jgi:catechol 2,3-dioxygenase-like lactoylglutathione lyase family enzyme
MPGPEIAVRGVTVDVTDLPRARHFWSRLLDLEVEAENDTYVWLGDVAPGLRLILQRVPEPKTIKNRVHLEISPTDPDSAIAWIESLGGTRIDDVEGPDYALTVMCDPDGNEFCVNRRPSVGLLGTTEMP